ncbi:MAG: hypothetical protein IPH65_12085 [Dehalococcoidia bacterium]|uniref:hypothetical protein n=1 Tax=Candidatus Amarobacter glycogenicus TaxID=3140699 RepID=UPI0031364707|nr:hypothetical protein [Dehalococcoidia bacterium]
MAARVRAEGTGFMKKTRLYPAHSRRLDPLSRELLTRDFDRLAPAGVAGTADSLVVDVNAWERHPTLSVPFLLIVGERDADFAPNADAFLSRFPPDLARVIRLPEAGHAANIEQPRQFEEAVTGFAREIAYLRAPAAQGSMVLTALGGALVFGGLGLLAAALFFTGGNDSDGGTIAAAPETTRIATQSPVAQVAGTSASGQPTRPSVVGGTAVAPSPAATTPNASPSAAATATPAPTRAATVTPTQSAPATTAAANRHPQRTSPHQRRPHRFRAVRDPLRLRPLRQSARHCGLRPVRRQERPPAPISSSLPARRSPTRPAPRIRPLRPVVTSSPRPCTSLTARP